MKRDTTYRDIDDGLDRGINDRGLYNLVGVDLSVVTRVRNELMLERSGVTRMCRHIEQSIARRVDDDPS